MEIGALCAQLALVSGLRQSALLACVFARLRVRVRARARALRSARAHARAHVHAQARARVYAINLPTRPSIRPSVCLYICVVLFNTGLCCVVLNLFVQHSRILAAGHVDKLQTN